MIYSPVVPEMAEFPIIHNLEYMHAFHCICIYDKVYIGGISSEIRFS